MDKLTQEEIRFIDTYLKNSGVEFLDVRIELTDHVASAIEQDLEQRKSGSFYEIFKLYMLRNKKNLVENANKRRWSVDRKVLCSIRKELFKIPILILGLGLIVILNNANMDRLNDNLWFIIPFGLVILTAYFIPFALYFKLKITFLNRLAAFGYLINYLFYLLVFQFEIAAGWLGICYGLILWVNIGILISAFKMSAYYKKQFHLYEKA